MPKKQSTAGTPDKTYAERAAALYDPDSVFRDREAQGEAATQADAAASAAQQAEERPAQTDGGGAAPIHARGERQRGGRAMTREMIRRIADRAEQAARAKRGEK